MPPGTFAYSSPATSLKSQRPLLRTQSASGFTPGTPTFGGVTPTPTPGAPANPSTMGVPGGGTQSTDQMGRVTTVGPGPSQGIGGLNVGPNGMVSTAATGFGPITIEDPDQTRRARDLADEQTRLATPGAYPAPRTAAPPAARPGPIGEIPWSEFEPKSVPREPGLTTLPREVGKGPEDRTAAESATFARAAERIGHIGAGNLRALRSQMTRRGITGSGIEAQGVTAAKNQTAGALGDVVRDQAIEDLRRQQEIDDRDLSAGIAQRGQDLGIQSTNYSGGISQRGQDLSQADWKIQALPAILALMRARQGA